MEFLTALVLLASGTFCIFFLLLNWNEIRYGRKGLPPGTMGWPVLGETIKFLQEGPNFMKKQRGRYGNIFKSHLLGSPTIVSMDPELNRYIFLNESKGLVPGYPQSILDILGRHNIAAVTGGPHKQIRGAAMSLIGPAAVREQLLPKIDKYIRLFLQDWEGKIIDIQEKSQEMAFFLAFKQILEDDESSLVYKSMKEEFDQLVEGTISLPIKLPGTSYYRGFQARKKIIKLLKRIIQSRRVPSTTSTEQSDMLNWLLSNDDSINYKLNDEEIYDQIIMILNSGYETVSTTTMMAIKYLGDHPNALEELMDEHIMIRQDKSPDEPIDWLAYKRMSFTRAVIFETMRLATIVNGLLRKATNDMELNGFYIPKGWKIYAFTREINYDPILYPEPFEFNPWRWLQDKGLESHNYQFLFGGGTRLCPGKELGIVTISMFLHYFVIKYRWEEIGEQKISQFPRVQAPKGLHIRIMKQQKWPHC
ncbi:OLC1v1000621C1 [Oldenlandia corymbosa var. corymbosa]|uniref:OLC1v1000621C1 n=1 Tax=Oldenlandia corymbosa var. corymbosa TaxID=529605 RepID=A0AAV1D4B1_OLDCO|nr:OLC1v1000621C1 [Oldenlandia corymbosa var. corymbosa]